MDANGKLTQALALVRAAAEELGSGSLHVPTEELASDVELIQQVSSAAQAAQVVRVAQYTARDSEQETGGWRFVEVDRGVGHVQEFAADTLAPMLAMAPGSASRKVHMSAVVASRLPGTLRALAEGRLDEWRAFTVAYELYEANAETCAAVEDVIYPAGFGDTARTLANRVRKALAQVDADAVRARAARARLDRYVRTYPGQHPGLTDWVASLPAEDSLKCWAAIDALAHQMRQNDPERTLEQCRADAFVDLIQGNATVSTEVQVLVPVETLATEESEAGTEEALIEEHLERHGDPDHVCDPPPHPHDADCQDSDSPPSTSRCPGVPAHDAFGRRVERTSLTDAAWRQVGVTGIEVPGIGIIPSHVLPGICSSFDTTISRVLLDPLTGTVQESSTRSYRPSAAIAHMVRLRDGTCRFPGCTVKAKRCEVDHVRRWPDGPTAVWNLACLCKHHHRLKHESGWRLSMTREGVCTWTDPYGRDYATSPPDHTQLAAA